MTPLERLLSLAGLALFTCASATGQTVIKSGLGGGLGAIGPGGPPYPSTMRWVPDGSFDMGCHAETGETCTSDELPVHAVEVDGFLMSAFEVTGYEIVAFLNHALGHGLVYMDSGIVFSSSGDETVAWTTGVSWASRIVYDGSTESFSIQSGYGNHATTHVSWYGAALYLNWLSSLYGRTPCYDTTTWDCDFSATGFRLPTEAEWEYAARGGEHAPYRTFPWGDSIDGSQANYWDSGDPWENAGPTKTTPVGYFDGNQVPSGANMANGYGLYDMAGNAFEWCNDWYDVDYYASSPTTNPTGPATGTLRVVRGGDWFNDTSHCRVADREHWDPEVANWIAGFRFVAKVY